MGHAGLTQRGPSRFSPGDHRLPAGLVLRTRHRCPYQVQRQAIEQAVGDKRRPVIFGPLADVGDDQAHRQQANQVPPLEGVESGPQQAVYDPGPTTVGQFLAGQDDAPPP